MRWLLVLSVLLAAAPAGAAGQFVQMVGGGTATSTSVAGTTVVPVNAAVQAGDDLLLVTSNSGDCIISTVVDAAGNSWAKLNGIGFAPSNLQSEIYTSYGVGALAAGTTITVTYTCHSIGEITASAFEVVGIDPANPVEATQKQCNNTGPATALQVSPLATTSSDDFIFAAWAVVGSLSDTFAVGSGYTLAGRFSGGTRTIDAQYEQAPLAGSYPVTATNSPAELTCGMGFAFRTLAGATTGSSSSSGSTSASSSSSSSSSTGSSGSSSASSSGSSGSSSSSSSSTSSGTGSSSGSASSSSGSGSTSSSSSSSTSSSAASSSGSGTGASASSGSSGGSGSSGAPPVDPPPFLPAIGCGCSARGGDGALLALGLGALLMLRKKRG